MKKNLKYFISTVAMACSMALTSLAGQWVEYGGKWFYMTDDGNFAKTPGCGLTKTMIQMLSYITSTPVALCHILHLLHLQMDRKLSW